ncbi:hypothetical protein SALBM135S_08802 [Streptomyces alboniger]
MPTSRATRFTCSAKFESWSTIVLTVVTSSRISPLASTVIFLERSPMATAVVTSAMFRTWRVRLFAMPFTDCVRSFQVPETPWTSAWPPRMPSGANLAGDPRDLLGEGGELVHHRVQGVLQLQDLAARVHVDLLGQVTARHRRRDLRDVAHLGGEAARHPITEPVTSLAHAGPPPGTCA